MYIVHSYYISYWSIQTSTHGPSEPPIKVRCIADLTIRGWRSPGRSSRHLEAVPRLPGSSQSDAPLGESTTSWGVDPKKKLQQETSFEIFQHIPTLSKKLCLIIIRLFWDKKQYIYIYIYMCVWNRRVLWTKSAVLLLTVPMFTCSKTPVFVVKLGYSSASLKTSEILEYVVTIHTCWIFN